MKKIFTSTLLLTLVFGIKASAQLSGVVNLPRIVPNLPNLAAAVAYLNTYGVSGAVTINCSANEIAPSGGYVLGCSQTLRDSVKDATRSITINGAGKIFWAPAGTGSNDAIFTVQGINYVTLRNFDFRDTSTNTTATTMMERGVSVVKCSKDIGTKTFSIFNSQITLNNTNTTAASGIAPLGATGIFVGNCTALSNTALALAVSEDGTNDGIFISSCKIKNVNHGVYAFGIPVIADGTSFNDKNLTILNDTIQNFTHNGVSISYSNGDLVNGCQINNLAGGGTAPTSNHIFGVRYANNSPVTLQTNTTWDCWNNNIDLTINSSSTYAATGIYTQIYGTSATYIEKDTIKLTSTGTSAQLNGIFSQNKLGTQRIANNVIKDFSTQTTNIQSVFGIYAGGYSTYPGFGLSDLALFPKSSTVTGNTISNWSVCSGPTALAPPNRVFAIADDNFDTTTSNITNNTVSSIAINNSSIKFAGYGNIYSYGPFTATPIVHKTNFTGNSFSSITSSSPVAGITNTTPLLIVHPLGTYPNGHTFLSSKNKVFKVSSDSAIAAGYISDYCLQFTIANDTINGITSGKSLAFGFINSYSSISGVNWSSKNVSISNSLFTNISASGITASGGNFASGIHIQPGSATGVLLADVSIKNNVVSNVSVRDTLGLALGISSTGGSSVYNINNNMISDIAASFDTSLFNSSVGIYLLGTGTTNVLFNTVNMVSSSTTAKGYGASGLRFNPSGANTIQNNIFHVNVLAGTTNNVSAVRSSAGSPSAAPSLSGFTASSNIYHSPTGPNNYLYVEGTLNSGLVNGYHQSGLTANNTKNIVNDTFFNSECNKSSYHKFMQTASSSRERNTFTENNLSGTGGVFSPSGLSYAESAATDGAISVDFLLNPRPFGSSDIGALEFTGTIRPKMNITVTSSTGFDTACTFKLPVLSASIPSYFNRVSYQWYRDTNKIAGATSKIYSVGPLSSKYVVKVYDSVTGCEYASNPFLMTIVPPPPAQITYYDSLTFCESSAIVLQANKGYNYSYRWMRNSSFLAGETDDHLVVDKSGDYVVEVNTPLGCASYSVPVRVKVYPLPKPTISWASPRVLTTQKFYLYQWYKNNIKIDSFAQNRTFFCFEDGAYSVEVTDSNGCTAKSDVYLFSLGIDEGAVSSSIKIYPNPAREQLYINSPIAVTAKLTDITGRVVKTQEQATVLNLTDLAEGMYLLSIMDKEGNLIRVEKINKIK